MGQDSLSRPGGPDRERLLRRLRERLDRFDEERNAAIVLDPQAIADAASLLESLTDLTVDLEAASLVGWLRWARYLVLNFDDAEREAEQELEAALPLFAAVYRVRPDLLPSEAGPIQDHFP